MSTSETGTDSIAAIQNSATMNSTLEEKKVSVRFLRNCTLNLVSTFLNPPKVIPTEDGLLRDWRGLAELCGISSQHIISIERETDQTSKVLKMWSQKAPAEATIEKLLEILEIIERFDVIDDVIPLIEDDLKYNKDHPPNLTVQPMLGVEQDDSLLTRDDLERQCQGLPGPQLYNAYVLFDDADIEFATLLIDRCEKEFSFRLCVRGRDLLPGLPEVDATKRLIAERCFKLIVIVSPEFYSSMDSNAHRFYYNIAEGIAIEKRTTKILPCIYKDMTGIMMTDIGMYSKIDFKRPWDQWDRLRDSLKIRTVPVATVMPTIQITDITDQPRRITQRSALEYSTSQPTPGLKSIMHHHLDKAHHSNEHVRFEPVKSHSTGNITEVDSETPNETVQSSSSTVNLEITEPSKITKKNSIKDFLKSSATKLLRKSKSNSSAESSSCNSVTNANGILAQMTSSSTKLPIDKNHVEEDGRKKDDSTTEKEKKNEKSQTSHSKKENNKKSGKTSLFKIKTPWKKTRSQKVMIEAV